MNFWERNFDEMTLWYTACPVGETATERTEWLMSNVYGMVQAVTDGDCRYDSNTTVTIVRWLAENRKEIILSEDAIALWLWRGASMDPAMYGAGKSGLVPSAG